MLPYKAYMDPMGNGDGENPWKSQIAAVVPENMEQNDGGKGENP